MKKILLPLVASLFAMSTFAQSAVSNTDLDSPDIAISVYPNPAKDFVIVNNIVALGVKEIEVFNVLGTKVKRSLTSGLRNSIKLDLSNLDPGIFFVRSYDNSGNLVGTNKISASGG